MSPDRKNEDANPSEPVPEDTRYLDVVDVLGLHAQLFGSTLQEANDHLLKPEGLASALARPQNYAVYQTGDAALLAAVLAHGIAGGQIFLDGNKRTALVAMETFLRWNGYRLVVGDAVLAQWILELSTGLTPEALADRIRGILRPL